MAQEMLQLLRMPQEPGLHQPLRRTRQGNLLQGPLPGQVRHQGRRLRHGCWRTKHVLSQRERIAYIDI